MRQTLPAILLLCLSAVSAGQTPDTLEKRITRQWTLSGDFTEEIPVPVDTAFNLFHNIRTTDKYSAFNAYPGNYGLPLYQINFFDRIADPDNFLYRYYYPFMHMPGNSLFMNTQVPFSEMVFTFAGPRDRAEQVFRVRHSQNASRYLNFGLIYDVVYSLGQYSYQRTDDKTFSFNISYTGDKYKLYASAGVNNLTNFENGGITDNSQLETFETRDVEVKLGSLSSAKTILKNRNLLLVQRFTVNRAPARSADTSGTGLDNPGKFRISGVFSHIFTWEKTRRTYSDDYPVSGLYDSIFIDDEATFDSLSVRVMKNTIRFDFSTDENRKFSLGGGVGLRNELFRYSQIIPSETSLPSDTAAWNESNNLVVGRLFNNIGRKFRWIASGELYLTGFRSGDFSLNGTITKQFDWRRGRAEWNIFGSINSTTPSFWFKRYGSNHFTWENNLQKEFRIDAGTAYYQPGRRFSARFNYAIMDNYAYFGYNALPDQHTGGLSVASLLVKKELSAWKFHLASEILLQQSSNTDIVDLPLATVRSAAFFSHNFHFKLTNGNLNTQAGAEVLYYTAYDGYSYMPSTGVYYNTRFRKTGNYPYLTAFINFKVKRTRIFLVLDHFNAGLTGYNYFMVPSYPMSIRMFRYGLAWTFYD